VVTNQPVVARGEASLETLAAIHGKIDYLIGEKGAFIDSWLFCPHHPDKGFAGEITELKITCDCRKPATGMIDRACDEMPIHRRRSWLIGDTTTDILTARNAGLRSILVRTGYAGCDDKYPVRPDYISPDLQSAVDFLIDDYPQLAAKAEEIAGECQSHRIITITAPAHSGKSSFASALAEALQVHGRDSRVVSLDGFIQPPALRGEDFASRHDLTGIRELMELLSSNRESDLTLEIPHYNRLRREPSPKRERISLSKDMTVILEGVAVPLVQEVLHGSDMVVWIKTDEAIRKARFMRDYGWRGVLPSDAAALWEQRTSDESLSPPPSSRIINL
jgi:histidinol-phosphate phosphatase family protein